MAQKQATATLHNESKGATSFKKHNEKFWSVPDLSFRASERQKTKSNHLIHVHLK